MEIKEAEEEVARWKEACELEVKAGKKEIEERDKMVKTFFIPCHMNKKKNMFPHSFLHL